MFKRSFHPAAGLLFGLTIVGLSGCQSWMAGYPLQSPTRVPPPGTNSYNVPSTYYNNTGGSVSQLYQGVPVSGGAVTLNPGMQPSQPSVAFGAQGVQPATYTTPGAPNANTGAVSAGYNMPTTGAFPNNGAPAGANANLGNNTPPPLNWQP